MRSIAERGVNGISEGVIDFKKILRPFPVFSKEDGSIDVISGFFFMARCLPSLPRNPKLLRKPTVKKGGSYGCGPRM
jgi:hypothetical protein